MAIYSYHTLQAPCQGLYKEKGSKFMAFAYPVDTEEAVKEHIRLLKKEYFDARHHGYAYILGPGQEKRRAFDDGEPSHSTGDPILGQIRSRKLTDVLVVVVRYFGGVKLGVGGLVSAYKAAAEDALNKGIVVEREMTEAFELLYDYAATPEVMRLVKEFNIAIQEQDFSEGCRVKLISKLSNHQMLFDKIKLLKALGVKLDINDASTFFTIIKKK
jgi:uncharacterized YigZ family protein